jgi:uncharacterized protein (DUF305 family)
MMRTFVLPSSVLRRGLLAGAAVTASLVLSACGGDTTSSGSDSNHGAMTAPASTATFNEADVTFAQSMIPHHQQAVQMAAMADGRASSAAVKDLAAKIKAAQQPEIDTMNGWLTAWHQPAAMPGMSATPGMSAMPGMSATPGMSAMPGMSATPTMSAMPGMGHGAMAGMMTDADMAKLMDAKGKDFDKQFLTMMIAHHEGAVTMAKEEIAKGSNPDATALAGKIIAAQQAEITTMHGLLGAL